MKPNQEQKTLPPQILQDCQYGRGALVSKSYLTGLKSRELAGSRIGTGSAPADLPEA